MRSRQFEPSAIVPVGDALWVAEEHGHGWARVAGDPPSLESVVDIGRLIARSGPQPSAALVATGQRVWAATDEGVVHLDEDGAVVEVIELGGPGGALAVSSGVLWVSSGWSGTLARIALRDGRVTRFDAGGPIDALVAGEEGAWIFRRSDDVVLLVRPDGRAAVREVQLEGHCSGMGLSASHLVVAFTTNRIGPQGIMGGLARIDRATGAVVAVIPYGNLPSGLIVDENDAWIAHDVFEDFDDFLQEDEDGDDEDDESAMPDARSVITRIDLSSDQIVRTFDVAGQIMDLVGDRTRLWALIFSRAAQAMQVLAVDPGTGETVARIDFSDVDVSTIPEARREFRAPFADREPIERLPRPSSPQEAEERIRAAADKAVHSMVHGWSGRTGEPLPPRPFIPGFEFEPVRLRGEYPATRLQFLFRSDRHADCRFGWEADLWDEDGSTDWDYFGGEDAELPDPEAIASNILVSLQENLEAAGYGPPDECDPDEEGVTWVRHPYGGKPSWEWDFNDSVEWALRQYAPGNRPFSREVIRSLLDTGITSTEQLVDIVTSPKTDEHVAAAVWLLHQLGDASAFEPLLERLEQSSGDDDRLNYAKRLRAFTRPQHAEALLAAYMAERVPEVRAALMEALACVGGAEVCDLAAASVLDRTEPVRLRAAAACTLGMVSVGDPQTIETLTNALADDEPEVTVGAARGLAMCARTRARAALEPLLADERSVNDKTVGELIQTEIDHLDRLGAYETRHD